MSDVYLFQANTTKEAYDLVRTALGSDAFILRTTRRHEGWLPWRRRSFVEVEAIVDVEATRMSHSGAERHAESSPVQQAPGHTASITDSRSTLLSEEEEESTRSRLGALDRLVSRLKQGSTREADSIPTELFQTYADLLDLGVEQPDARDLILSVTTEGVASPLPQLVRSNMLAAMQHAVRCQGPIQARVGERRVVALIGPTGVGKTTTIAKLASGFQLQSGIRTGLITTDTFRSAAIDQLRTYAETLDMPLEVAADERELQSSLSRLATCELVLIDTTGRSPRDEPRLQELRGLLRRELVDEVHLVLSLTSSMRMIEETAARFSILHPTAMLLTKLDEASGPGVVLSVARRVMLPISYLTTGQGVPDDIEVPQPRQIARRLLRDERPAEETGPIRMSLPPNSPPLSPALLR